MLSNIQLEQMGKYYNLPLRNVLMKDELVNIKPLDGCYIINLQSSTQGNGTHWTLLIINEPLAYYSDSFGQPPAIEVENFIKQNTNIKHFAFNTKEAQNIISDLCGWYCIGLMLYYKFNIKNKKNLYKCCSHYYDNFKKNTKLNGDILKEILVYYSHNKEYPLLKQIIKNRIK